ncbi:hypothetical protein EP331_11815 [bacterium]|nr:MAG: hypothetical protein EP331_11815 [bacterium]
MKKIIMLFVFILASGYSTGLAQVMTEPASGIERNGLQVDVGTFRQNIENSENHYQYAGYLFMYGLTDNVELRLEGDLNSEGNYNQSSNVQLSPLQFGIRYKLLDDNSHGIQVSAISHVYSTRFSNSSMENKMGTVTRISTFIPITSKLGLGNNVGFEAEEQGETMWFYTGALLYNQSEKLSYYVEVYGNDILCIDNCHSLDVGVAYALTDALSIDTSFGFDFIYQNRSSLFSVVFSYAIQ